MKTKFTKYDHTIVLPGRNLERITPKHFKKLTTGDHVRVETAGESFWVKLTSRDPLKGRVDNFLLNAEHGLQFGDEIVFEPENVLDMLFAGKDRNEQLKRILTPTS